MTRLVPLSLLQGGPPGVSLTENVLKVLPEMWWLPALPGLSSYPALIALYHATKAGPGWHIFYKPLFLVTRHPPPRGQTGEDGRRFKFKSVFWLLFHTYYCHIWCFDKLRLKSICFLRLWQCDTECKWPLMLSVIWPIRLLVKGRKRETGNH